MDVRCSICEYTLRKDKALFDAQWEEIVTTHLPDKVKYVCRTCARRVAQKVLEEYGE
jgi:uncharacterized protein YlaI